MEHRARVEPDIAADPRRERQVPADWVAPERERLRLVVGREPACGLCELDLQRYPAVAAGAAAGGQDEDNSGNGGPAHAGAECIRATLKPGPASGRPVRFSFSFLLRWFR